MTMKLGCAASTAVFFGIFLMTLIAQVRARRYHPLLYWSVILSTTTVGTTMSDYLDRTARLGYIGGSLMLIGVLISVLATWRLTLGSITFDHVSDPKIETFYWVTILFSNTLGTALGDFMADSAHLGYVGGALAIGAALAIIVGLYFCTQVSRTLLFWLAFVLTRPLGATLGDTLNKTHAKGPPRSRRPARLGGAGGRDGRPCVFVARPQAESRSSQPNNRREAFWSMSMLMTASWRQSSAPRVPPDTLGKTTQA
jgi:uncharacterized membrane-anchored protein